MNSEHVVICDDNDSIETVEILDEDAAPTIHNKNSPTGVGDINLNDEKTRHTGPSHLIEIEIDGMCNPQDCDVNKSEDSFTNLLRNNRLVSKLVKKCLNMNAYGMSRVVQKTVLPMYKDTDRSFKESARLRRILKTTLKRLELDPTHKFSHIKTLCDLLQLKKHRKKVPFITLSADVTNNRKGPSVPENNNTTQIFCENNATKTNEETTDVIDLVDSDKDTVIILDNNEEENDVIILEDRSLTPWSDKSNKENISTNELGKDNVSIIDIIQLENEIPNTSEDNNLLLPHKHEEFRDGDVILKKVQMIEAEIASTKSIVAELEEQEVTDSMQSAYLQCDKMKVKIVKLYEELCRLTGEQAVKRREVRLQVTEGHPAGPVRNLEQFLNRNIDSTGTTLFPDFHDVVNCVQKANKDENLGWDKAQVMKEALSLFTQCGHALRKRRQKREWRDLMSLVKQEQPDGDPANEDPQLLARLEENKRLAREKEHDVLERFTQMEYQPTVSSPLNPRLGSMDILEDTSDSESEHSFVASSGSYINNCESFKNNVDTDSMNIDLDHNVSSHNIDETTDIGSKLPVQIKQEPKDIQSLLDGLGSDYTVTVFDIEDPFLVIEISSDSSYSDDDCS